MSEPSVCCILLTRDRPDFAARAVRCFRAQTYQNKRLFILDTGDGSWFKEQPRETHILHKSGASIGGLRNIVNELTGDDVIAHLDDDDWSAPDRLAQQIAFMELSGKPVVGYFDMPFYDLRTDRVLWYDSQMRNYSLGTALMYRRVIWDRVPFPHTTPEDTTWQNQVGQENIAGMSSLKDGRPMMIQTLHGGNAAANSSGAIFQAAEPGLESAVRSILKDA